MDAIYTTTNAVMSGAASLVYSFVQNSSGPQVDHLAKMVDTAYSAAMSAMKSPSPSKPQRTGSPPPPKDEEWEDQGISKATDVRDSVAEAKTSMSEGPPKAGEEEGPLPDDISIEKVKVSNPQEHPSKTVDGLKDKNL
mgnify:CR=1 FL=1